MDRIVHAYIIESRDGSVDSAVELAAAMLCGGERKPCRNCAHCRKVFSGLHPDLTVVSRLVGTSGKPRREIIVSQIREIIADAPILPNEAGRKVYIVREAELMNLAAQNAFLKLLEEPPYFCSFILSARNRQALLPTVRSRCAEIADNSEMPLSLSLALEFVRVLESGPPSELLRFCSAHETLTPDELSEFIAGVTTLLADALCSRRPSALDPALAMELTHILSRCAVYLRSNVNTRHVWGLIAARTIGAPLLKKET